MQPSPNNDTFEPDELPGFEKWTRILTPEDDGELCATLVRTVHVGHDPRPAVLYLHGFVDYFFQSHLAESFEAAGFRFYALDLRRHGRSIRPMNRANFALSIDDYFDELGWALTVLSQRHPHISALVAHSTGALIAIHYLARAPGPKGIGCLVMNSPFFRFWLRPMDRLQLSIVVSSARWFPKLRLPVRLNGVYGGSISRHGHGEWDYDLTKKPIRGFPLYAGWFRMIVQAQAALRELRLHLPVLCLHAGRSKPPGTRLEPADFVCDTVLNVVDMQELAPKLGPRVTVQSIEGALHDLVLSAEPARTLTLQEMVRFVAANEHPFKSPRSPTCPNAYGSSVETQE